MPVLLYSYSLSLSLSLSLRSDPICIPYSLLVTGDHTESDQPVDGGMLLCSGHSERLIKI